MVADEQPVSGWVVPCAPVEVDGPVWLRPVGPGEAAVLVAAYADAVALAAQVRVALAGAGVSAAEVVVVPGLTDAGRPVARLPLTARGVRRFGWGRRGLSDCA